MTASERTPEKRGQSIAAALGASTAILQPARSATSRRRCELDEFRPTDDDHRLDLGRSALDRLLAIGGGVADVLDRRRGDGRETALQRHDDLPRVVDRQRRLGDVGERRPGAKSSASTSSTEPISVVAPSGNWPIVPITSGWPAMADQQHVAAALVMDLRLAVNLGDQRAGRVDGEQIARPRLFRHRLGDAVGGEDHRPVAGRRLGELLDEHDALGLQRIDDVLVVDDLVPHVHRRAVDPQRGLDRVDRPHDAGAEAARGAQNEAKRRFDDHCIPGAAPIAR